MSIKFSLMSCLFVFADMVRRREEQQQQAKLMLMHAFGKPIKVRGGLQQTALCSLVSFFVILCVVAVFRLGACCL